MCKGQPACRRLLLPCTVATVVAGPSRVSLKWSMRWLVQARKVFARSGMDLLRTSCDAEVTP